MHNYLKWMHTWSLVLTTSSGEVQTAPIRPPTLYRVAVIACCQESAFNFFSYPPATKWTYDFDSFAATLKVGGVFSIVLKCVCVDIEVIQTMISRYIDKKKKKENDRTKQI